MAKNTTETNPDSLTCVTHPSFHVIAVCKQCQEEICLKCKYYKHNDHSSEPIEDAVDRLLPSVSEKLQTLENTLSKMTDFKAKVDEKISEVKSSQERMFKEVDKHKHLIQQKIGSELNSITMEIKNHYKSVEEDLEKLHISHLSDVETMGALVGEFKTSLDKGEGIEYLRFLKESDKKCDGMLGKLTKFTDDKYEIPADVKLPDMVFEKTQISPPVLGEIKSSKTS